MEPAEMFQILAVSLGLGLLVGLQRERSDSELAGIRTFPLITMLGTLTGLLACAMGGSPVAPNLHAIPNPWILGAGFIAVSIVVLSGNLKTSAAGRVHSGITSEVTILTMYALGAFLVYGPLSVGAVAAGVIVLLLHAKSILHTLASRMGDKDMRAIMTFVLISLVVLPAVPDRVFDDAFGLNPRNIWMMVVLVVGMSLTGYVMFKIMGPAAGTVLAGVLGGLVSSTATTASYSRRAAQAPEASASAAAVILIAGVVVYARVAVEIALVAPAFARAMWLPLAVAAGASLLLALKCWLGSKQDGGSLPEPDNPTELKAALIFAAVYTFVLVAIAVAKRHFGDAGVYTVAGVSGLTDMDAITLSVSRMTTRDGLALEAARRSVFIAAAANTLFKAGMAASLGGPELRRHLLPLMGIQFGVLLGIALFWPS